MEYLVRFAQTLESFRTAELRAVADLVNVSLDIIAYSEDSPFCIVRLPSEHAARALAKRSVLAQGIFELWGTGSDYDTLRADVRKRMHDMHHEQYRESAFKFKFDSFRGKRNGAQQRDLIESFNFLDFQGPIRMNDAELQMYVFEHFDYEVAEPNILYLGRWLADGDRRAVDTLDLKKRRYIGLTSMDAELSLVTANMALAAPGKIIYDPFVGTGSFSVACAYFGALALGSDIDGRTIRGSPSCNHYSNYAQYNLQSNFLDNFTSDLTNSPLRIAPWLDAIVCDPPYGIREGAKVLGSRDGKHTTPLYIDGVEAHARPGYIFPKRPYGFDDMLQDTLEFAVRMLVPNGRLSMWMPTANDDDVELAIPNSPGLELVSVCVQTFNKWSRRLLTYRRLAHVPAEDAIFKLRKRAEGRNADDLNPFRKKYFEGFRQQMPAAK